MNTHTLKSFLSLLLFHATFFLSYSADFNGPVQEKNTSDTIKTKSRILLQNPENGHYYEFIPTFLDRSSVISESSEFTYLNMRGYLATISNIRERNFVLNILEAGENPWISGTDEVIEGQWVYDSGPEIGKPITFLDWGAGEPNNLHKTEHYLHMDHLGRFNDLSDKNVGHATGFLVEYGGFSEPSQDAKPIAELRYFRDEADIVDMESLGSIYFKPIPSPKSLGLKNGTYWFEVTVNNTSLKGDRLVFEIPTHNLTELSIYKKENGRVSMLAQNGNLFSEKIEGVETTIPTYSLKKDNLKTSTYYFKTTFLKEANFPLRLYSEDQYYAQLIRHKSILSTYYGILLAVVLFNLALFFRLKEKVFLYYVCFLVSYSIAMLLCDGVLPREYWYFSFFDSEAFLHLIVVITMLLFTYQFLDLKTFYPQTKKVIYYMILSMGLMELTYLITKNYLFFAIGDIIAVISFLTMLVISITLYKKLNFARFYIFGYVILIIYSHYHVLGYDFGVYSIDAYQNYFKVAGVADMVIFTYAISYRLESINNEYRTQLSSLQKLLDQDYARESGETPYTIGSAEGASDTLLTMREMEVLKCLGKGSTNAEIADQLFISQNTVKFHIRNIYQKLEVKSRVEALDKITTLKLG